MIRALIVDDEPIARRTLRLLLERDPQVELVADCDALEAAELIPRERPDLLFLDVQMPGLDGFELLERIGIEAVPAVVFVTAYDRHALRAFEVAATDYLLKPFDDARFGAMMRRVKNALASGSRGGDDPRASRSRSQGFVRRFVIRNAGRWVVLDAGDVDWIEAADYYACLHAGLETHLLRQTMADLERRLDPSRFFRVHRSRIVNLERVRELAPQARGDYAVVLEGGAVVPIGHGRLEALRRRLGGGDL